MPTGLTSEDQLCLLLARSQLTPDVHKQISELIANSVQWQLLVEHAYEHQIAPLLHRSLEILDFHGVPETVRAELANCLAVNAIRNELLAKESAGLLQLLGDAKIPVIPLKSTVLAAALYEDPAHRVCADIDLLVPPQHVIDAHELILSLGYHSQITQPFFLKLLERYGKDCEMMREDSLCTYPLELHCGLVWGGRLERDLLRNIWADAVTTSFYGVSAFALSSDWEFLYLAVHAARHGRHSLKWFIDLDRFCSRVQLDWASIKQKAQRLGWEDAVRDSLLLCAELLGTPIDPVFSPTTSRRPSGRFDLTSVDVPGAPFSSLRLLPTPAEKLRFLVIRLLIPTPADGRYLPLPPSLAFLYYLLRPIRVVAIVVGWVVRTGVHRLRQAVGGNGSTSAT